MPRKEALARITPNSYYHIEATLKYLHETQDITTAVIEQDNIQKRIKLPRDTPKLHQGALYSFEKCFYSKNGWLRVDDSDKIKLLEEKPNDYLILNEIYESRAELNSHYVTTILEIVEIGATQKKIKNGEEFSVTIVKGFADDTLVDLTVWNKDLPASLVEKTVIVEGVRVKLLTSNSLVLVSTVYTKFHGIQEEVKPKFNPHQSYRSISQLYFPKNIEELNKDIEANGKSFSIVTAKIEDILIFNYQGCSKCRKKIETGSCETCGEGTPKGQFLVAQLLFQDETGEIVTFVFDEKIIGAFRLVKKGSVLTGKIKSNYRQAGKEKVISNVLNGVSSIQF